MNLKDTENADLAKAVEYCEANKTSDIYISDIVARIRKLVPKKEAAPAAPEAKPAPAAEAPK